VREVWEGKEKDPAPVLVAEGLVGMASKPDSTAVLAIHIEVATNNGE